MVARCGRVCEPRAQAGANVLTHLSKQPLLPTRGAALPAKRAISHLTRPMWKKERLWAVPVNRSMGPGLVWKEPSELIHDSLRHSGSGMSARRLSRMASRTSCAVLALQCRRRWVRQRMFSLFCPFRSVCMSR